MDARVARDLSRRARNAAWRGRRRFCATRLRRTICAMRILGGGTRAACASTDTTAWCFALSGGRPGRRTSVGRRRTGLIQLEHRAVGAAVRHERGEGGGQAPQGPAGPRDAERVPFNKPQRRGDGVAILAQRRGEALAAGPVSLFRYARENEGFRVVQRPRPEGCVAGGVRARRDKEGYDAHFINFA